MFQYCTLRFCVLFALVARTASNPSLTAEVEGQAREVTVARVGEHQIAWGDVPSAARKTLTRSGISGFLSRAATQHELFSHAEVLRVYCMSTGMKPCLSWLAYVGVYESEKVCGGEELRLVPRITNDKGDISTGYYILWKNLDTTSDPWWCYDSMDVHNYTIVNAAFLAHEYPRRIHPLQATGDTICSELTWPAYGHWVESTVWEGQSCTYHNYTSDEAHFCLHGDYLAFLGDSSLRRLWWGLMDMLLERRTGRYEELYRVYPNVTAPTISGEDEVLFEADLQKKSGVFTTSYMYATDFSHVDIYLDMITRMTRAPIIIMGIGLHVVNKTSADAYVERSLDVVERLVKVGAKVIWSTMDALTEVKQGNFTRAENHRHMQRPMLVEKLNREVAIALTKKGIPILDSFAMTTGRMADTIDGVHYVSSVEVVKANVLLNFICANN